MMKPASHPEFPWTGIFLGAPILGIWYWCTDQVIVQRVLSAKDEGHAKAGTIFAGFLKILPVFVLVLPGLIAFGLYPQLFTTNANGTVTNGDIAYPTLIVNLLPSGLVGLMVAALLAALMGGMASVFNSASTLVTLDFYKRVRPAASEKQLVFVGRIATGVLVVLGLLWVPFIKLLSSQLYIYLQSVQAYISPPIAACFILGILWTRLNGAGSISALLTGLVLGSLRFVLEVLDKSSHFQGGGRALAARHELPALRDPDVRDLLRRAGGREPAHARAGSPQARGPDVRDGRRQDRYGRRDEGVAGARVADGAQAQRRIQPVAGRDRRRVVDLLPLTEAAAGARQEIRCLRANVTQEEALAALERRGGLLRGRLRQLAAAYLPFRLYHVEVVNRGDEQAARCTRPMRSAVCSTCTSSRPRPPTLS